MSTPFFSIVMATHRRPHLLARALASLRAQTCQDYEILLVADELDTASAALIARELRETDQFLKRSGPPGPAASRNLGLALARGEWVIFFDDDDSFEPHHLAGLLPHCRRADLQVVFSDVTIVTEDRLRPGIPELSRKFKDLSGFAPMGLWVQNFIPLHCAAYRRSLLQGLGFDTHLASQEDWEFLLSVCSRCLPRHVPGGGAVIHKDYVNAEQRGRQESSNNTLVLLDFLYTYRRWPAPTPELREARATLMRKSGLDAPVDWY